MIEAFSTIADGTTDVVSNGVDAGVFTNIVYRNTDLAHREYQGWCSSRGYQLSNRWSVNGHYTLQLQERRQLRRRSHQPAGRDLTSSATTRKRSTPRGTILTAGCRTSSAIASASGASTTWTWAARATPRCRVCGGWTRLASYQPGGAKPGAHVDAARRSWRRPAIRTARVRLNVFFGERGSEEFAGYGVLDMSFNYNVPVFRTLRPWVKFDVYNLFNNQKLIAWNTTISQDPASPKDSLGYATEYIKSPTFGTATGNTVTNLNVSTINAYPVAFSGAAPGGRTLQVAARIPLLEVFVIVV